VTSEDFPDHPKNAAIYSNIKAAQTKLIFQPKSSDLGHFFHDFPPKSQRKIGKLENFIFSDQVPNKTSPLSIHSFIYAGFPWISMNLQLELPEFWCNFQ
jgi:hypothetical protein